MYLVPLSQTNADFGNKSYQEKQRIYQGSSHILISRILQLKYTIYLHKTTWHDNYVQVQIGILFWGASLFSIRGEGRKVLLTVIVLSGLNVAAQGQRVPAEQATHKSSSSQRTGAQCFLLPSQDHDLLRLVRTTQGSNQPVWRRCLEFSKDDQPYLTPIFFQLFKNYHVSSNNIYVDS